MSAPPTILERGGYVGLGDKDLWLTWEAHLHGAELDEWNRVKRIFERATPEFRAAGMNLLASIELQEAREGYKQARMANERCRVDRIVGASEDWKTKIRWFSEALGAWMVAHDAAKRAAAAEAEAWNIAYTRSTVIMFMRTGFRRIYGPWDGWAWPGAAWGRGQSAYDTPDGVAQVKAEVAASHRRRMEGGAPRASEPEAKPGRRAGDGPGLFETKK